MAFSTKCFKLSVWKCNLRREAVKRLKGTDFSSDISTTNQREGSEHRQILLEELLELLKEYLSAFCHIYFVFGCFHRVCVDSISRLHVYDTMLSCEHVLDSVTLFFWVLMRWCNIYNLAPFLSFSVTELGPNIS